MEDIKVLKFKLRKEGEGVCPICGKTTTRRGRPFNEKNLQWHMFHRHGKHFAMAFQDAQIRKKKELEGVV